nr:uncharacterized protein C16orf95 homolog isoform X7 [Chlorocebus sabaeus]
MDVSRNSPFQTYKKEVCLPGHSMHPGPWAVCCECQTRFGGRLPVPRVEAALPYWVPLSLRPRKQMVRRQESLKGIQAIPGHPLPSPSEPRETSALQQTLPICQQRLSG